MAWEKVKLGDVATSIQTGPFGSQLHQSDYSEIGIPVVMPKDMINGKIIEDSIARVEEKHVERLCRHKVSLGDILYARRGDVGKCSLVTKKEIGWLCGTGCLKVSIDFSKANPQFVFYQLQKPETVGWVEKHAVGATMLNLNTGILESVPIEIPSLKQQNKIVDILSAYDNLIENNQKQIKLLEEAAQRLYKQWFIDLCFPGHETTPIKDGLPEGWRNVQLGDVLEKITTGLNPRKNFVLGKGSNYYVTIKNLADNNLYLDDKCDKVDDEALVKINNRSSLKEGDILFSGIGTIGRVYLVCIPTKNWNVSESLFTMRANQLVSKEYLYLVLLSSDVQSYCNLHAHGAAQKGIRMADLKAYKFNLPSMDIVNDFTKLVKPFIEKVQVLQKECSLLTQSRDRLLPKLMSGEMDV